MTPLWSVDQADATAWLQALPVASVDLIVTDPPYASLEKHRARGTTTRLTGAWFPVVPNEAFLPLFRSAWVALKPGRHLYVMTDSDSMVVVREAGVRAGFTFWNTLVWDKQTIGMGYHYRRRTEFILFFEKPGPKRKLADLGRSDLLSFPRVRDGYPTEKPVDLLEVLVHQSARPGELVVDPFTGSGSTGEAAARVGCRFAGCDVQPEAVRRASERLSALAWEAARA